jgi:hypothetical protein
MTADVDARELSRVVERCPAVASLTGGPDGLAATYLPGDRVPGVRITPDAVELHVIARWGLPMADVADEVRRATLPLVAGRHVDVVVEDVEEPAVTVTAGAAAHRSAPTHSEEER